MPNIPPGRPTSIAASQTESQLIVRARYDFTATEPGELSFHGGALIQVLDNQYRDWWRGSLNGEVGVFPSNYVAIPRKAIVQALHDYSGTFKDDFSFRKGQVIFVLKTVN